MVGCCVYGMNVHVQSSVGNFLTSQGTFLPPIRRDCAPWSKLGRQKILYFCLKWFVSWHNQTENPMKVLSGHFFI